MKPHVLIIGNPRETHVAGHFLAGADSLPISASIADVEAAFAAPRWFKSVCWRLLGHRPARLNTFNAAILKRCAEQRPDLVLTTGIAPLNSATLGHLHRQGIATACFLTDDPWNQHHHARWFMRALPLYDHVFTPRRANITDLQSLHRPAVHYLPFAYSPAIHHPPAPMNEAERSRWSSEVLFIGGADEERAAIMRSLVAQGFRLNLWGGYWDAMPGLQSQARGHAGPEAFRNLVAHAAINLCLVRRANRDGHSMRSFELPAVGGCLLVEDTEEHRELFGADDECVRYFASTKELADRSRLLLKQPDQRQRLALAARQRIVESGLHRYADRLRCIVETCLHESFRDSCQSLHSR